VFGKPPIQDSFNSYLDIKIAPNGNTTMAIISSKGKRINQNPSTIMVATIPKGNLIIVIMRSICCFSFIREPAAVLGFPT
jgi:hypothetical protein